MKRISKAFIQLEIDVVSGEQSVVRMDYSIDDDANSEIVYNRQAPYDPPRALTVEELASTVTAALAQAVVTAQTNEGIVA